MLGLQLLIIDYKLCGAEYIVHEIWMMFMPTTYCYVVMQSKGSWPGFISCRDYTKIEPHHHSVYTVKLGLGGHWGWLQLEQGEVGEAGAGAVQEEEDVRGGGARPGGGQPVVALSSLCWYKWVSEPGFTINGLY